MPMVSSCSSIFLEDGESNLLLDCGGGHDIIGQFHKAGKKPEDIKNIFISHYDSDHILGFVPLARVFSKFPAGHAKVNVFCSIQVKPAIDSLFQFVANMHIEKAKKFLNFVIISDRSVQEADGLKLTFFDVKSNKSPEFGCVVSFPSGKKLSFLGDEPLRDHYLEVVENSDVLIHEAFCLDSEKEIFQPHEKNHGTVREAAENASKAKAGLLVLFHMEDKTLKTRKQKYLEEAKEHFKGNIFVPMDLDVFEF